jgi:hypothetical protein
MNFSSGMDISEFIISLWPGLVWPLIRLIFFISVGLIIGNLIEAMNWTHHVARLTTPIIQRSHLSETAGAGFSISFFSAVSANTMLSEAFDQGRISKKELVLANLFNSLPTYFLHMPTLFFLAVPLLKSTALIYVGITFIAALLRSSLILVISRIILPPRQQGCITCKLQPREHGVKKAVISSWKRFKRRIKKILFFTVPIYTVVFVMQQTGLFGRLEAGMAEHISFLSWLAPQSLGIVALQLAAEISAGMAAAAALLDNQVLQSREVVLALLAGNVLSTPMRAFRHQFPFYAGIFQPRLATELIFYNQLFRVGSIIIVGVIYGMLF